MRGVNKVIIIGNLGADPEVKQFQNGGSVTSISVATSEKWNDKQTGEPREQTEWHRISLYNKLGEIAAQYLRKGSSVYIEGSLRTRKYQDQNGQDRFITEIRADQLQMLGGNPAGQGGYNGGSNMQGGFGGNNYNNQNGGYQGGQGGGQGFGNNQSQGFNSNSNNQNYQGGGNTYNHNPTNNNNPYMSGNNNQPQLPNQAPDQGDMKPMTPATSTTNPQMNTPKPGAVDDDIPF